MCCYILLDECYACILFSLDCFYICLDFMASRINYNYNTNPVRAFPNGLSTQHSAQIIMALNFQYCLAACMSCVGSCHGLAAVAIDYSCGRSSLIDMHGVFMLVENCIFNSVINHNNSVASEVVVSSIETLLDTRRIVPYS